MLVINHFDQNDRANYSLHIATPKIRDYSYRLFSVSHKALEMTNKTSYTIQSWALDPKNNKAIEVIGLKNVKLTLEKWLNDGLAYFPVKRLEMMASLKVEKEIFSGVIPLIKAGKKESVTHKKMVAPYHFTKIVATQKDNTSKFGNWMSELQNAKIEFEFKFTNGSIVQQSMHLLSHVTPNTINPIFDISFYFPESRFIEMNSMLENYEGTLHINSTGTDYNLTLYYTVEVEKAGN